MSFLMSIDLGTSSTKTMIATLDGKVVATASQAYDVSIPQSGWAEQDPELWYQSAVATIKKCFAISQVAPERILALSFSGQMHGLICLDSAGNVLRPAIIWSDQRSSETIKSIYRIIGKEQLQSLTQNSLSTGFLLPSLVWVKENEPDIFQQVHTVMLPKDYIKYRFTGEKNTDFSDAAGTLAYDNISRNWSYPLLEKLGLPTSLFPPILPSTDIIGAVTSPCAKDTGLATKTKVINGGSDQCMQSIGNQVVGEGVFAANIGTGGQVSTTVSAPIFDPQFRTNTFSHAIPEKWNIMGACLSSGASLKWYASKIMNVTDYQLLDSHAKEIQPGSEGALFLPYLNGERTPHLNPYARGVFFGLTSKHGKYHLARSVMEGVVFSLRNCKEILTDDLNIPCKQIIASGGGAKSPLWLQIQADIFEQDVYRSKVSDEANIGAIITAGVGIGVFADFQQGCEQFSKLDDVVYSPIPENVQLYRQLYEIYNEIYTSTKHILPKLNNFM